MRGGDCLGRPACGGGEIRQGLFVTGDESEDAAEKARLRRGGAQGIDFDPGQGEEARQELGIAGEEAERLDGERFGLVVRDRARSGGAEGQGKRPNS